MHSSYRVEVAALLTGSFEPDELRHWLREVAGDELADALPGRETPLAELARAAVEKLEKRSAIDIQWFDRLRDIRPRKVLEIDRARRSWQEALRGAATATADIHPARPKTFGDADTFQLLIKVSTEDFVKSTKAMAVDGGCVLQVSTRERGPHGGWTTAEALTFVPNTQIVEDRNEHGVLVGRRLVGIR